MSRKGRKDYPTRGRTKQRKKHKLKRLFSVLVIIFVLLATVASVTAYAAVKYFLSDLPPLDLKQLEPAKTSFLYDREGNLVTPLMGAENRVILTLDEISPYLVNAFIAIEDDRFFEHPGFDLRGIMRAVWNNIFKKSGVIQGGSTITQQLVKDAFLTPERTLKRKVQEIYIAYKLEKLFSKEEILELYLNRIFFDYNAYGVEAAAQTYFNKSAKDVTLAEAAMLAGIPNLPGRYSPYRNFEEAKKRQRIILNRMAELGMITKEEAEAAANEELKLAGIPKRTYPHPWFVDHVVLEEAPKILKQLPEYEQMTEGEIQAHIYTSGLHIYTTLDQRIQQALTEILDNPEMYSKNVREEGKPVQPQTAAVVAEPDTGYVVAIFGGRENDSIGAFNRATDGKWQAGSVLKPILAYAPAFNEGLASPATVLDDAPTEFAGIPPYYPNNYTMRFLGLVTARYALAHSLNIPAVHLLNQLGVEKGKEYAKRMGITSFDDEHDLGLSMVVGGLYRGVSPWDVAQAFAVLANEGIRTDFTTITKIVDSNGRVIYEHEPNREEILSPEAAWLTTSCLLDTVRYGTATSLKIGRPVAVKTGTSEYARDAWVAAYTPDYVTTFWLGEDSWPQGKEGNYRSFEIVGKFMNPILKAIHEDLPVNDFTRPSTLRSAAVCKKSGKRPGEFCPESEIITDWFKRDQLPSEICDLHVEVEICSETGLLASEFCPEEVREKKVFLNRPPYIATDKRWPGRVGRIPEDAALMPPTETCDKHVSSSPSPDHSEANFTARQISLNGDILLSWKPVPKAKGYWLARKGPEDSEFVRIVSEPIIGVRFTDRVDLPGTYTYQIIAVNDEGVESAPLTTSVIVRSELEEPEAPQDPPEPEEPNMPQEPKEPQEPGRDEEDEEDRRGRRGH